ncbi:MAG: hypothetical protein Q8O17_04900, partial [Candidatus Methanoperedens sp.]|nr:hypothetical protein [Candidatus Methanoperedens sp.]
MLPKRPPYHIFFDRINRIDRNYYHIVNINLSAPILPEALPILPFPAQRKQTRPDSAMGRFENSV